ncbi:hypothetical protein [Nostoc sp.]|uniref:hypothetical protein n=1 Tax=Nostoc sp. TaxID=1180 RepID=UPI002FF68ABA
MKYSLVIVSHVVDALLNELQILQYAKEYMDKNIFSELSSDIFWTLNKVDHNNDFVINQIIHWIKEAEYWSNDDYDNPKTLPYDEIMTSNPDIINVLSKMLIKSYNAIVDKRKKQQLKNQIKKNEVNKHNTHYLKINFDSPFTPTPDEANTLREISNAHLAEEKTLNQLVELDENTLKLAGRFDILTKTLTRLAPNNQNIINLLINIFKQEWDDVNFDHYFCLKLVTIIDKIEANKQELMDFLNKKLLDNNFVDDYRSCCIAEYLLKIESENHIAINILNESLPKIKDDKISLRIASVLVETNTDNRKVMNTLVRLLYDRKINEPQQNIRLGAESISNFLRKVTYEKVISCLAKMAYQSNDARIVLDDIFQKSQYVILRENVAWRILELEPNNQEALVFLLGRYKNQDNSAQYFTEEAFIDFLREYPESINNFINLLRNCQDVNTSKLIIRLLREVSNENYQLEIVKILKEILNTTKNEGIIYEAISDCIAYLAVKELGTIANQNLNPINTLINIISHTNDNEIKIVGIKSLSKIGVGNLDVVNILINLMNNPSESKNYSLIRKSLLKVMQGRLFAVAVAGLKDNFIGEDEDNDDLSYILWHCAENMSYPEFYRAWHGESSPLQNLETQFTHIHSILTQLQPTAAPHGFCLVLEVA